MADVFYEAIVPAFVVAAAISYGSVLVPFATRMGRLEEKIDRVTELVQTDINNRRNGSNA